MAKILLVDDDTLVRTSLSLALEDAGHAVVQAVNGDEGLDALAREMFDVVVLDILIPEREGIETIREIRKKSTALPVLAISGGDKTGWKISSRWLRRSAPMTRWPSRSPRPNSSRG